MVMSNRSGAIGVLQTVLTALRSVGWISRRVAYSYVIYWVLSRR